MSDLAAANTASTRRPRFDDRVDTDTAIGSWDVFSLLRRALQVLTTEKRLLSAKIGLGILTLIPGAYLPWLAKIVIDQVLLQRPFGETEVLFPPHVMPLVHAIGDFSPMGMMAAVSIVGLLLLLFFGRGGTQGSLSQGEDSATQAENAMNAGESESSGAVGVADALVQIRLSQRLANRVRTLLFQRMARLPMTTLDDHRIGDAVYRVMYDAPMLPHMCYRVTLVPLYLVLGAAIALYLVNYSYGAVAPELVWASAALIPAGLLITLPLSAITRRVQQDSRAAGAATTNAMEEGLGNIAAVQSLGGMAHEKERVEARSKESFRRYLLVKRVEILLAFITIGAITALGFWIYIFVSYQIIDGAMSPGDWGALFGLGLTLGGSTLGLGTTWIELQASAAALRRVFFFVDLPAENTGRGLRKLPAIEHGIAIESVDFRYPEGRDVLQGIDLDLRLGELIAIVGPTGAGKTSLAYLLPAYLRPSHGRVLVDGHDLAEVDVDSLREQVAYVFQEHLLLSESIRANLRLVRPQASDAELRAALETACALDFVEALPDGLDTILGPAGDTLSVGQKQRLCIARGVLRETPILILDEPTAALDPQTENALMRSLLAARKGRLVVVISHRLSTVRLADRIVFLEDGRVRDVGSHDELMGNETGPYRRFVALQSGE